ncbi:hypothetical protein CLOM_g23151 [Closterium sp. NIES-68]|nr:hypothetical protein CLOM_g23151 [Closterium sp. NIES-68]GJP66414.1 hypothetical protein CLOP_g23352 [Closterium sp. NIES-67]
MKERGGGAALLMARSGEEAVEVSGAGLHARGEETVRMSGARMEERGGVGGTSWRHGFDLDLMDLQMPGMDGFAAADAIRAHERKQVLEMAFKARQVRQQQLVAAVLECALEGPQNQLGLEPLRAKRHTRERSRGPLRSLRGKETRGGASLTRMEQSEEGRGEASLTLVEQTDWGLLQRLKER